MSVPECQTCGACCTNPDENRSEGFVYYVELPKKSRLLENDTLRKRFVHIDDKGAHMRLDPSGRCSALKGQLGVKVGCQVYDDRPRGCRLVEAGSARCFQARRERGL
jgi:uncharacterized protein